MRFVEIRDGRYAVTASVDDNSSEYGSTNFIVRISGVSGSLVVANEIVSSWTGSSLLPVGDGLFGLSSGVAAVEVVAAGDWAIEFQPAPVAPPSAEAGPLSGRGQDVLFVELGEGRYVVAASVDDNATEYGSTNFTVRISGVRGSELIANEIASSWMGSSLLTIGTGVLDVQPGVAAIEVTATGDWTIEFQRR